MSKPKKIVILRHGIAAEPGTPGYEEDSQRPLTREGVTEMRRIAKAMKVLGLEFDLILSSPYVRARQTAEIVAEGLGLQKKPQFSAGLRCGADPRALLQELKQKHSEKECVLLVGHEPFLSEFISLLISGNKNCSIDLKKGGLCLLAISSFEPGESAVLKWLFNPKQLLAGL